MTSTAVRLGTVVTGDGALARALREAVERRPPEHDGIEILVLDRADPSLLEQQDARTWAAGTSWLPVIASTATLRIGPVIAPGRTACFRCVEIRQAPPDVEELLGAPLSDPGHAPDLAAAGYGAHHVTLALAAVRRLLADPPRPDRPSWGVRLGLLTAEATPFAAFSMHGCPRCAGFIYTRDSDRFRGLLGGQA